MGLHLSSSAEAHHQKSWFIVPRTEPWIPHVLHHLPISKNTRLSEGTLPFACELSHQRLQLHGRMNLQASRLIEVQEKLSCERHSPAIIWLSSQIAPSFVFRVTPKVARRSLNTDKRWSGITAQYHLTTLCIPYPHLKSRQDKFP